MLYLQENVASQSRIYEEIKEHDTQPTHSKLVNTERAVGVIGERGTNTFFFLEKHFTYKQYANT